MSVMDTLITDRTQSDVDALKALKALDHADMTDAQRAEWARNSKGSYNASDLNRVGEACAYLYELITTMGYAVPGYTPLKTDWYEEADDTPPDSGNRPDAAKMTAYITTIEALKSVWNAAQAIPESMNRLTYEGANNIEKLLLEVDDLIRRISQSFVYSGMVYSGQLWGT